MPASQAAKRSLVKARVASLYRELLMALGEDPKREGLRDTPKRVARFWDQFLHHEQKRIDTTFVEECSDDLVMLRNIEVWSMCEHHLLPFYANVTIAYLPGGKRVIGASKLARIAIKAASGLQLQERMARQIADQVQRAARTEDVAVVIRGHHLCMTMRGIKMQTQMVNAVMRGEFRTDSRLREEFYALDKKESRGISGA